MLPYVKSSVPSKTLAFPTSITSVFSGFGLSLFTFYHLITEDRHWLSAGQFGQRNIEWDVSSILVSSAPKLQMITPMGFT